MKHSISKYYLIAIVLLTFAACSKSPVNPNSDPLAGLTKVAEGYADGAATKVALYTKGTTLYTGYSKFYLALFDSITGQRVENAKLNLTPIMNMGTMSHSAPFENPESENSINHLFPCSVTFTMPSGSGSWTLQIKVLNNTTDKEGLIMIPLTITEPVLSKQKSFTAQHNGSKYFISLIEPSTPKIGINDFEIAIYKKTSMMSWPADSSLSVTITPEMPSMGHGSPNNINPVHVGKGHYKGKVNFTMTGLWRINLDFMSGTAVADTTQYFDIEF
ncbi:MAG TPA: FixH family protein [Chitinophagaceae bacterium]|jgi:hypothetical protein|nr:FixH family protein [Chitinophagaceae bacterium]HMX77192.1 FixH family protein [Chitinophagaceae bacterium]HNA90867.1 FixH family protein [Chitinophagaceae bacterium]HNA95749.1 FixH family protein [Chitinophagaceae bacterium]HNC38125.1 FixH family protein [Chitinophagaceae bacterium]